MAQTELTTRILAHHVHSARFQYDGDVIQPDGYLSDLTKEGWERRERSDGGGGKRIEMSENEVTRR